MSAPVSRPVRVLRIIARLNVGGPAQHVVLLTDGLTAYGYETRLLAGQVPSTEGDMSYYAAEHGVEPLSLPTLSREIAPADDLKSLLAIYRLCRRWRPDIVHTHTAKAGLVGRTAAWLAGVPIIVHTYHGHVLEGYFSRLKTRIFRSLEQLCGGMSDSLIAVSDAVRDDLVNLRVSRPGKMRVIHLGLDLQRFAKHPRGALRAELGLAPETPLIGFCGRLVPIKNVPLLLTAAARLLRSHPDVHFALVGDGELREELEQQAHVLGLADRVHFLGWRRDTPALLGDLDLMALTSLNEGTPVALIEAGAAGVPAVSTAVGGVGRVVVDGETGWLVPSQDEDALVDALVAALDDGDERAARGRRAQAHCLGAFGAERLCRDIASLYDELLQRR